MLKGKKTLIITTVLGIISFGLTVLCWLAATDIWHGLNSPDFWHG